MRGGIVACGDAAASCRRPVRRVESRTRRVDNFFLFDEERRVDVEMMGAWEGRAGGSLSWEERGAWLPAAMRPT